MNCPYLSGKLEERRTHKDKRKTKGQKNKIDMEELKVKVVEVSQEKEQPQGNDYIRVTVEIDGRKIAVWTTESNINALRFDIDKKR